jgi:heme/copper-type cytochrome/quinol oxidase subunit 2
MPARAPIAQQLLGSPHRVRLFRNDLRGDVHWLHVLIPDQQRLVWGSMRLLLAVSVLFTLIIVLAFLYTLRTIYRRNASATYAPTW